VSRSSPAAVVLSWLALCGPSSAAEWVELKTDGFTVYGDDGEKAARKVAGRLEAFRGFLKAEWPWARFVPDVPVVVVALEGPEPFRLLLPAAFAGKARQTAGVTLLEPNRTLVLLQGDVPEDPTEDNPHHAVYHEYVHTILGRTLPLPTWLNEGLAEYWASVKIKQHEVELGRPIGEHVFRLRSGAPLPLETLFRVDPSSVHYNEAERSSVFYAQSWALVHYLALAAPARKGQLNRLFTRLADGRDEMEATREVLGDFGALEKELAEYVSRRSMPYRRGPRTPGDETVRSKARRLSKPEVLALRGGVLLSGGRPGQGRPLIEEALQLDPGLGEAAEAMGIAAFTAADRATAGDWLARAEASGRASFYTFYLLAQLIRLEKGRDAAARAEVKLREAVRLNPRFAPAYTALASVLLERGGARAEAVQLVDSAIGLDRSSAVVRIGAADVLMRLGEAELARTHAQVAVRLAPNARFKTQAAELLGWLESAEQLEKRCDAGEAAACATLSAQLEVGAGVPMDKQRAAALRAKACAAGFPAACTASRP
jgi:tetratricopeptide (TPR) repeat protein